jgi:hypothetical protein
MSLKDRLSNPGPVVTTDTGFSCSHYKPINGSKRCARYLDGGSCARPEELMCIEWLKANGHKPHRSAKEPPSRVNTPDKPLRDLFGNPIPEEPPSPRKPVSTDRPVSNENILT